MIFYAGAFAPHPLLHPFPIEHGGACKQIQPPKERCALVHVCAGAGGLGFLHKAVNATTKRRLLAVTASTGVLFNCLPYIRTSSKQMCTHFTAVCQALTCTLQQPLGTRVGMVHHTRLDALNYNDAS